MQEIMEFLNSDVYMLILSILVGVLFISCIILIVDDCRTKKQYRKFVKKLGNGNNIQEDLEKFMNKVERVESQNADIINYCKNLDSDISRCIQKVGIVRYSAFKDTGSDLSFAVALLDEKNDGIVFNGIYSREMSNIYAKPVNNGTSTYTLSEEEIQALDKAIKSNNVYREK